MPSLLLLLLIISFVYVFCFLFSIQANFFELSPRNKKEKKKMNKVSKHHMLTMLCTKHKDDNIYTSEILLNYIKVQVKIQQTLTTRDISMA